MAIIEKKYLLNDSVNSFIKRHKLSKNNISQFYTQVKICKEVRYRKIDDTFFKTVRTGSEVRENIVNKSISHKKYLQAKEKKIGKVLKKERFTLADDLQNFAIDRYKKHLKNITILEVSFKSLEEAETFKLPDTLKVYIQKDVSDDDRYRNKNLALLGNPKKLSYSIYAIFKDIERERLTSVADVIFPEMIVSDAVRIVLYRIYHALKVDRAKLLEQNDIYALERFRKNLKQAKILLEEYRHIFDQNMYKKVSLHLNMIDKTIAIDKDLTLIRANLKLLESAFSEKEVNFFIARIDKRIEDEKHKVKTFFKTREFAIIFRQFDLLLKEQSNVHSAYHSNTTIKEVTKSSVNKRFKKLLFLTKKYDKCHDVDSYKKMKKALYKTKTIMDNFAHLYENKVYKQMQSLLDDTDDKFAEFINLYKRSLIIKTYIRNSNKALQEQQRLINKVQKKRKTLEKELNKDIDASIQVLKENKALFKK